MLAPGRTAARVRRRVVSSHLNLRAASAAPGLFGPRDVSTSAVCQSASMPVVHEFQDGRNSWRQAPCIAITESRGMCQAASMEAARVQALRNGTFHRENFVEEIVLRDLQKGTYAGRVVTRFPPEPNGHLHIGHAKSIYLNFGIANKFGGVCHLRFDDTNPASEKQEYIDSIMEDVKWLGMEWHGPVRYASDYFGQLYEWAVAMVEHGWAYVDQLSAAEISTYRGTLTTPGKDSPYRDRPVAENLELLEKMRSGALDQGSAVLRAKIDMAHRNVTMRDPIMYRIIKNPPHPRTQDKWMVYPSYDWAHGLSDSIEKVTHSLCTMEFNMHNELYNWFNERVQMLGGLQSICLPRQYEFARLEMTYMVLSKRKLKRLVDEGHVDGWDDPRMPTLAGMRRRGYPATAGRHMCKLIGISKVGSTVIEYSLLENCVRTILKEEARIKLMCVLKPLRVVVTNWSGEDQIIEGPREGDLPSRQFRMGGEVLIDQDDFMLEPTQGFKRFAPGRMVKLRYGYTLTCEEVIQDESGCVVELRCSYDPESLGKRPPKKVAVIHWVHATMSVPVRVRLYNHLFTEARPEDRDDFTLALNPNSLEVLDSARCELSVREACRLVGGEVQQVSVQFERCGYFVVDKFETSKNLKNGGPLVFNRTVALNDPFKEKTASRGARR